MIEISSVSIIKRSICDSRACFKFDPIEKQSMAIKLLRPPFHKTYGTLRECTYHTNNKCRHGSYVHMTLHVKQGPCDLQRPVCVLSHYISSMYLCYVSYSLVIANIHVMSTSGDNSTNSTKQDIFRAYCTAVT